MSIHHENGSNFSYGLNTHDDPDHEPKSDTLLLTGVFVLNLVSGATTIRGAMQLLSPLAGFGGGVGIQFMLLILSSGKSARHAPLRKWMAVGILSTVSIYTSFFSYYGIMTHEKKALTASSLAVNAFVTQKAELFEPIDTKVSELAGEIKQLERQQEKEIQGNGTTGLVGFGSQAILLAKELEAKEKEYLPLQEVHKDIAPYFNKDLKNVLPEDILKMAQMAYAEVPKNYRGNTPPPNRNDYIDIENSVEFLAPIHKLKRRESDAIAAISVATFIDGMIIILATAVTIKSRKQKGSIESITKWSSKQLLDTKIFVRTVKHLFGQPVAPMPSIEYLNTELLDNSVHMVSFRLRGRASNFLTFLYHNLDTEKWVINHKALLNHNNDTYRLGYRMMIDELQRLRWIAWHRKHGVFATPSSACYASLTTWLNSEMVRLAKEEARLENEGVVVPDDTERAIVLHFPKA